MLAEHLSKYREEDTILLAIPRGGVPIAYEVATQYNIPMDVVIIKKISHPLNPEYAVGAAGVNSVYIHPRHGRSVSQEYIQEQTRIQQTEALERYKELRGDKPPLDLLDTTVILVDDGVATGATMLMGIQVVREQNPAKIIVAVPVAPPDTIRRLEEEADEVVCLLKPSGFMAIGQFYRDFHQVPTEEAKRMLEIDQSNR